MLVAMTEWRWPRDWRHDAQGKEHGKPNKTAHRADNRSTCRPTPDYFAFHSGHDWHLCPRHIYSSYHSLRRGRIHWCLFHLDFQHRFGLENLRAINGNLTQSSTHSTTGVWRCGDHGLGVDGRLLCSRNTRSHMHIPHAWSHFFDHACYYPKTSADLKTALPVSDISKSPRQSNWGSAGECAQKSANHR